MSSINRHVLSPDDSAVGFLGEGPDPHRYGSENDSPLEAPGVVFGLIPFGARVLDVGCGEGWLAERLRLLREARVVGIEPQPERAAAAGRRGVVVHTGVLSNDIQAELGLFDVIVFLDVLEHLADPAEALRIARTMLAPNGFVVASIPNVAHWTVRLGLLMGRFEYAPSGIMDATHLRWFTLESIHSLFQKSGYRLHEVKRTPGLWMGDYRKLRPWNWLRRDLRNRVVLYGLRRMPSLFACQFVVKATMRQEGFIDAPTWPRPER